MERMIADARSSSRREMVNRRLGRSCDEDRGSSEAREEDRELGPRRCWCGVDVGVRRSESVPDRIRAIVEVTATIETCVAADVGGRLPAEASDEGSG